ncbi:DinB family protein [Sporocytophaga myxococcoides]|uniref:DinB family protein n=1 Tax=Sporocytophaga myxococcoides TaxID=153721 RepID=UPI00040C359F|nr:DinB family protein [Sporocytophaga myxococcoides]
MQSSIIVNAILRELDKEVPATRNCLERIPENLFGFKPHPTSMELGYLTTLVAQIPLWIASMIDNGEIDLATFTRLTPKTTREMVTYFEDNINKAKKSLQTIKDDDLSRNFTLKAQGKILISQKLEESISEAINHWIHHRGQLTVYMRMNGIPVPSIYGPSADDNPFR